MFIVAPHILYLLALAGVGLVQEFGGFALTCVFAGALGIGLLHTYVFRRSISRSAESLAGIVTLILSLMYAQMQGEHYLHASRYWLASVLVLRSFRRAGKRDYVFCLAICAVIYLYVGRIYSELPFLFLTLANLVVAPYALFYFLLHYGGFHAVAPAPLARPLRPSWAQVRYMAALSVLLAVATSALFILMPRPRRGSLFDPAFRADDFVTGLGDSVELGSFDTIREQRDVAMIVQTDRPTLWRGSVMDRYEYGKWTETIKSGSAPMQSEIPSDRSQKLITRRFEIVDLRLTNYQLFSDGNAIMVLSRGGITRVWTKALYATLFALSGETRGYAGVYETISLDKEYIGPASLADKILRHPTLSPLRVREQVLYLQLPDDLPQRIRDLAAEITRGRVSAQEKAQAVEEYLGRGFTFSMTGLAAPGPEPLEHFLFQSRKGHCQYFATAMAVLLRCAGVETRVVQGFAPGTYVDGRSVVRMSDAHLWTEVFYPGLGWKAHDPSPGSRERVSMTRHVSLTERIKLKWYTHVLQYDRASRADLFSAMADYTIRMARIVAQTVAPWKKHALALAAAGLLAMVLARLLRGLSVSWLTTVFRSRRGRRAAVVRAHFGRYLREIARKGYRREPGTTPNDLIAAMERDRVPVVDDARRLTNAFYANRFGGLDTAERDEAGIRAALARIGRWARA